MGETGEEIVDLAFALRRLDPESVPVNFLIPFAGTPLEGRWELTPERCLRILALFRFCFPDVEVRLAGGREIHLRGMQVLDPSREPHPDRAPDQSARHRDQGLFGGGVSSSCLVVEDDGRNRDAEADEHPVDVDDRQTDPSHGVHRPTVAIERSDSRGLTCRHT